MLCLAPLLWILFSPLPSCLDPDTSRTPLVAIVCPQPADSHRRKRCLAAIALTDHTPCGTFERTSWPSTVAFLE